MSVALSDGTVYKDSQEWLADSFSKMPLGGSTEPAGALKPSGGTQVPAEGEKVDQGRTYLDKSGPGYHLTITDADIETAMNIGLAAGPGTMAGVRSAAIKGKLSELGHAQVLESAGEHPDVVHKETGFFRGADGRWRYEINDSASKFTEKWHEDPEKSYTMGSGATIAKLGDILDHPELYKAYPMLKDINVIRDPGYGSIGAVYEAGSGPGKLVNAQIRMGTAASGNQGTLMHEVQHAIQGYEGFAKGGNPESGVAYLKYTPNLKALEPEMRAILEKAEDPKATWTDAELNRKDYITAVASKYREYTQAAYSQAHEYYSRLAGEVESRNVDTRLLLTEAERRKIHPAWTEDTPRSKQLVREEPTKTTAYGLVEKGQYVKPLSEPIDFRRGANDNDPNVYNPREPGMIGSKEADGAIDASWKAMVEKSKRGSEILDQMAKIRDVLSTRNFNDIEWARYKKLTEEHQKLFPPE